MNSGNSFTEVRAVLWTKLTKHQGKSKHIMLGTVLRTDNGLNLSSTCIMHELSIPEAKALSNKLLDLIIEAGTEV